MSKKTENMNGYQNGTSHKKLNQFGDYEDTSNMTVGDWVFRWSKNQTQFHMPKVHPMLEKHIDTLTRQKKNLRIFLPLCGKSVDLNWLAKQGHEVVGCDCVDQGCKEFFEEHDIPYKTEPIKTIKGTIYKATNDKKITLFCCDYFELSSKITGTFDCIWDRGSFVAIGVDLRKQYMDITLPLLRDDSTYLLDCFLVDNKEFGGPPFNCDEKEVKKYFGSKCTVKKIDERDCFGDWQKSWGVEYFIEEVYLLTPKTVQDTVIVGQNISKLKVK